MDKLYKIRSCIDGMEGSPSRLRVAALKAAGSWPVLVGSNPTHSAAPSRYLNRGSPMSQQAPGKHFRKGITMSELFKMFPDDKAAEEWFESRIWKGGRKCPACGNAGTTPARHPKMPYYCYKCRSHFSVKKGTIMQQSEISYQNWAIATYLFAVNLKGVSSMRLHRDLGITQKSAWFMIHRLRESWKQLAGVDGMEGPVEIDETT